MKLVTLAQKAILITYFTYLFEIEMKKTQSIISLLALVLISLSSCMPSKVAPSVTVKKDYFKDKPLKIAIVDFNYEFEGEGTKGATKYVSAGKDGGHVISNILASELNNMDGFQILERSEIEKLLDEQKLQVSGVIDESSAVEIGKMIGADAVILGDVTDYLEWTNTGVVGSTVTFSARLVDIESSQMMLSTSISRIRFGVQAFHNVQLSVQEVSKKINKELN